MGIEDPSNGIPWIFGGKRDWIKKQVHSLKGLMTEGAHTGQWRGVQTRYKALINKEAAECPWDIKLNIHPLAFYKCLS